jgi:hypothetical protein
MHSQIRTLLVASRRLSYIVTLSIRDSTPTYALHISYIHCYSCSEWATVVSTGLTIDSRVDVGVDSSHEDDTGQEARSPFEDGKTNFPDP